MYAWAIKWIARIILNKIVILEAVRYDLCKDFGEQIFVNN